MRRYYRHLVLTALVALIASSFIGMVLAPPLVPIGGSNQSYPFESQPTAVQAGSRAIGSLANVYDGDTSTKTATIDFTAGYVGFETFEKPSDISGDPADDFAIEYVDFKMRYTSLGSIDDEYRIVYYVGGTGPVVLKDWIGGSTTLCKMDMGSDTLAETWGNQSEPEDGTWTWAEIASIKFRFETRAVGPPDLPPFLYTTEIYEIWLSVYPNAPPVASTTVSVMPPHVEPNLALYDVAFVDLYVANVEKLQVYEALLLYDSAVLYAMEAWTYWPFTAQFYLDLTVPGEVSISYFIATTIPYNGGYLTDHGWNGTYPLARIYFYVMDAAAYSWLLYDFTQLIAPGGIKMPHADFHGLYGEPPPNTYLMVWTNPTFGEGEGPFVEPICTWWHENPCCRPEVEGTREWHLTSWEDNEPGLPGLLDASDQIDMESPELPGETWWFHVDNIGTVTPSGNVWMILTFKYKEAPEFPLGIGILMMLAPLIPIIYVWRRKR